MPPIARLSSFRPTVRYSRSTKMQARASVESKEIVVVGSANADLVIMVSRLPKPGETLAADGGGTYIPGGKGANQAAACGRLGHPTAFAGQVGRDGQGALLRSALGESGVDLSLLADVAEPTGQAVILLQPGGENSIVIVGGANASWAAPAPPALARIRAAGLLLLQREVPEAVNLAAAQAAAAAGVPVLMDAGGAEGPLPAELLRCVTILSPNETELARLTGLPTAPPAAGAAPASPGGAVSEELVLAAAARLQQQGVGTVLVKLGAHGALLVPPPPAPPLRQRACPVKAVVDTTGAGDCFTGAYAVAQMEGRPPREAMAFAAAAAALCVQRLGAMPSLPRREEVEELLATSGSW